MSKQKSDDKVRCSFCGRRPEEVTSIIAGPDVYICDMCIGTSMDIIRNNLSATRTKRIKNKGLLTPTQIKSALDEYVIGQDQAKKTLAVAVYNHYKRIDAQDQFVDPENVEIEKSNIMLIGSTGTGKTLLAQTLARILDVPFAIADATTLTEAGYVGDDVETVLVHLLQNADYNVDRAERGIVYIDEIDKLAKKFTSASTRDVSGEGVQQAILKILEGTVANVQTRGSRRLQSQETVQIDTTNILFICSGAFTGLEEIIRRRLGERGLGFGARVDPREEDLNALRAQARTEDLIKYGMIPEFMGRIPVIVACDDLSVDDLMEVLHKPRNSLQRQYQYLFELEGVKLRIEGDAQRAIAEEAHRRKSGARGLRSILEEVMLEIMYDLPSLQGVTECIIDERVVHTRGQPILVHSKRAS